ncbi:MAG TPA: hypothetical protein VH277_15755 [Gemmatimonadaceae bacterium]|jgi:hypothetical protein|nr:hypothetical protein [Gemmatimonadaceae bacterium]
MSHLPTERLAALVDETPTAAELAHLASCGECARERAAFQSVADLAGEEASRIGIPLTSWETLRPSLIADGMIADGTIADGTIDGRGGLRFRARQVRRPWLQVAAAALLVAGGTMAGRYSAGASPFAGRQLGAAAPAGQPTPDSLTSFRSIEDAVAAQSRAQAVYQSALTFIAQHDTAGQSAESAATIRTRLAALDETGQVLSEARQKAPYDPVINGYYLTTMGQREATLRQLNNVMPASMQITSY